MPKGSTTRGVTSAWRMSRRVVILAVTVLSASFPMTALGGSYVGLFEDPAGMQPCTSVPPGTARTLYVIAKVDGAVASGLTGAEFRIEFGNATGWFASYVPPTTAKVIGDPIDLDPDPNVGGGLNLAFPTCQTPLNGMLALGTVSVFNNGGTSTSLSVRRHTQPTNPGHACPLFTLCDASFWKICMSAGEAVVCSTVTVPKVASAAVGDEAVFEHRLSPVALSQAPAPPEETFTETIPIPANDELWVMAERITGPEVVCHFDGRELFIGGVALRQPRRPANEAAEARLLEMHARSPRVSALVASGMTIQQAAHVFSSELEALRKQVEAAYRVGGDGALRRTLESSPLIERVEYVNGGRAGYIVRGFTVRASIDYRGRESSDRIPSPREKARERVASIRSALEAPRAMLLVVNGLSSTRCSGEEGIASARAQIEYAQTMGTLEGMPRGPLSGNAILWLLAESHKVDGGR